MTDSKRLKAILILALVITLLCAHAPVLYTLFYHTLTGAPAAKAAGFDAAKVSGQERVILDGEWEFYWNRLLVCEPERNAAPDFLIAVPGYWSNYQINGAYLPAHGCASYRLTLRGLNASGPVTAYLPDFGSAYRVFIDGQLASQSGTVSRQPDAVFATTRGELHPVTLSGAPAHEIVIEVATTRFSGLYMAPVLQAYNSAVQEDGVRNAWRLILFGMALFSCFVLMATYILSFREGRRSFWMPALGILVLLRIMLTTKLYDFWQNAVFFGLSYEAANPLVFLATFAFKYLLLYMAEGLVGIPFSRREKLCFLFYYAALYLLYAFIPEGFYNRYLTILLPVAAFAMEIYIFFKAWRNRGRLQKYGLLIYLDAHLAIAGLILDCYYINGNSYPDLSLALLALFTVFMMVLSLVAAMRLAQIRNELVRSSVHLASMRSQMAMQADYYDALSAQINEARAARHDMRHFVGVMKQLSDEERYAELKCFLSEYADRSEAEPLPVFCENAVANSILGYYSLKAKERGVPFRHACAIPKRLSVSDGDLCVVLGNALENALEACERLAAPDARFISAEARVANGHLLIKIENACNCPPPRQGGRYVSAKAGPEHGMGLPNIEKVVDAYGGFFKAECDGDVFTLMAAFPEAHLDIPKWPPDGAQ